MKKAIDVKYSVGLNTFQQPCVPEQVFYGDLVYKFKRIVGKSILPDQFKKIIKNYKRVGYSMDIIGGLNAWL